MKHIMVSLICFYLMTQAAQLGTRWQSINHPTHDVTVKLKDEQSPLHGDLLHNL